MRSNRGCAWNSYQQTKGGIKKKGTTIIKMMLEVTKQKQKQIIKKMVQVILE